MKLQNLLLNIQRALDSSKNLAIFYNRGRILILSKMILYRLLFASTYCDYVLFGFENKRISQCSQYISNKTMKQLQRAMMRVQRENNPAQYIELVENKLAFSEKCASANIPTLLVF